MRTGTNAMWRLPAVVICVTVLGWIPTRAGTAQSDYDVVVDAGTIKGRIGNLLGVTCGPVSPSPGWFDLTPEYRWLRVPSVRIHDCSEIGDIHRVFPNINADPTKASNYDFKEIDRFVSGIVEGGMTALYRLGYSWGAGPKAPQNFDQFAEICHHIVLHFTQGWAGGFRYGDRIEWEVWNEANLSQSWDQSNQKFLQFYEKVARAIRRADPKATVGTCALAVNWPQDYQEGLIEHCAKNQIPLDFFSWHYYGWGHEQAEPYDFARQGAWVRSVLDQHGLHDTANYLTEWNVWQPGSDPRLRDLAGAAFCLSALMFMHDGAIDMAHHYRGDVCDALCAGLFIIAPPTHVPIARAHAFHTYSQLQDTPLRLDVPSGPDRSGFAVLAGVSEDGKHHQVLMSDFWSEAPDRKLRFLNLKPARRLIHVYTVNELGMHLVQMAVLPKGTRVDHQLPKPSPWIQLVKLDEIHDGEAVLISRGGSTSLMTPQGRFVFLATRYPNHQYAVLGSLSGSTPGTELPNDLRLPLNFDPFTYWLLGRYLKRGYDKFMGTLTGIGTADIDWKLDALDPKLSGAKLTFAGLVIGAGRIVEVTNPVTVTLYR